MIIDKRGEKKAVQAKCYSESNKVSVQTVRELVGAKRNHDCILTLLVTTSDLTGPAKAEAEKFKVEYWHGALLEQKLRTWGKWHPGKKISQRETVKSEIIKLRRKWPRQPPRLNIVNVVLQWFGERTSKGTSSLDVESFRVVGI